MPRKKIRHPFLKSLALILSFSFVLSLGINLSNTEHHLSHLFSSPQNQTADPTTVTYFQSGIFSQSSEEFKLLARQIGGQSVFVNYDRAYDLAKTVNLILSDLQNRPSDTTINFVGTSLGTIPLSIAYDWVLENRPDQAGKLILINPILSSQVATHPILARHPVLAQTICAIGRCEFSWLFQQIAIHESDTYPYQTTLLLALEEINSILEAEKQLSPTPAQTGEIHTILSTQDDQINNALAAQKIRTKYPHSTLTYIETTHSATLKNPEIFQSLLEQIF